VLSLPLSILSPAGARGRLSILIFHRVLPKPDPLAPDEPDVVRFEAQMQWVRRWFNVLPLGRAVDMLYEGTIPARALSITFDDGYADNEALAAPILKRLGLSATFFISTGFLDGGCMWNDRVIEAIRGCQADAIDLRPIGFDHHPLHSDAARRDAIATLLKAVKHLESEPRARAVDDIVAAAGVQGTPLLMMRPAQVRRLRTLGMEIGAHTITHPILTRLAPEAAMRELADSKGYLQDLLGEPVKLFAYPNGVPGQDYAAEHVEMARDCGFKAAVSTAWGAASVRSHRFQLPRFTPWDRNRLKYGVRLLDNLRRSEQALQ
jgi:peptidoglycan/xylan/chitin deacetylase (PgdA/CDA1 family)